MDVLSSIFKQKDQISLSESKEKESVEFTPQRHQSETSSTEKAISNSDAQGLSKLFETSKRTGSEDAISAEKKAEKEPKSMQENSTDYGKNSAVKEEIPTNSDEEIFHSSAFELADEGIKSLYNQQRGDRCVPHQKGKETALNSLTSGQNFDIENSTNFDVSADNQKALSFNQAQPEPLDVPKNNIGRENAEKESIQAKPEEAIHAKTTEHRRQAMQNSEKPQSPQSTLNKANNIYYIEVHKILPNPNQPRKEFPEFSILKLASSIQQFGIIQPLTVRKIGENYELIAGERRLRAAKELNWVTVPCIISTSSEEESAQIAIIENLLREDLNIFEEAAAIEVLIDTYGFTQEQVAKKLSVSQSYIANKLRLLRLNAKERDIILQNNLSERHSRSILRLKDEEKRAEVLNTIVSKCMNVQACEEYVDSIINNKPVQNTEVQEVLAPKKQMYKDSRAFYLAISKALDCAKSSELPIKTRKFVGETYTEITIIIPKSSEDDTTS